MTDFVARFAQWLAYAVGDALVQPPGDWRAGLVGGVLLCAGMAALLWRGIGPGARRD